MLNEFDKNVGIFGFFFLSNPDLYTVLIGIVIDSNNIFDEINQKIFMSFQIFQLTSILCLSVIYDWMIGTGP